MPGGGPDHHQGPSQRGTIKEIERTTDHGEVLYEVDVQNAAGVFEFDVAEDGTFRGFEEEEIPLSEVPDHVKIAAIAAVPGLVLKEAERERDGDTIVYELEGEANGKEYEVEISAAGEVLEIETDEDADDDEDEDD